MFPVDPPARVVRAWLAEAAASATEHHWKRGETPVLAADPNDGSALVAAGRRRTSGSQVDPGQDLVQPLRPGISSIQRGRGEQDRNHADEELHSALSPFTGVDQDDF